MADRPILMSAPMVRALLSGAKTQTRRLVKPRRDKDLGCQLAACELAGEVNSGEFRNAYCEPGDQLWVRETFAKIDGQTQPWIETDYRATYRHGDRLGDTLGLKKRWTPAIHMPRAASRISLAVTGVRAERLQNISAQDAIAEGISELVPRGKRQNDLTPAALAFAAAAVVEEMPRSTRRGFLAGALAASLGFAASPSRPWEVKSERMQHAPSPQQLYAVLWEQINGPGAWQVNPWVWVIGFGVKS